jgi:hypothetical protein
MQVFRRESTGHVTDKEERERESCIINDLASLDACPQAASSAKASRDPELNLRQHGGATA